VLRAAEQLGYRTNEIARSMTTGRTNTIGVVIGDIGNLFFADLVRGITDRARAHGFDIIIINTDESLSEERDAIDILLAKRVDGFIVTSAASHKEETQHFLQAQKANVPFVLADRLIDGVHFDAV